MSYTARPYSPSAQPRRHHISFNHSDRPLLIPSAHPRARTYTNVLRPTCCGDCECEGHGGPAPSVSMVREGCQGRIGFRPTEYRLSSFGRSHFPRSPPHSPKATASCSPSRFLPALVLESNAIGPRSPIPYRPSHPISVSTRTTTPLARSWAASNRGLTRLSWATGRTRLTRRHLRRARRDLLLWECVMRCCRGGGRERQTLVLADAVRPLTSACICCWAELGRNGRSSQADLGVPCAC